ncbi:MAG: alpha/beta fold hydrolase [Pyrinomonadaceae bacterium]
MRIILILVTLLVLSISIFSQDITGQWNGVLEVPGQKIPFVFNIEKTETRYKSTLNIQSQGVKGLPVTATTYESTKLKMTMADLGAEFSGELSADDKIVGALSQGGRSFPLTLSRGGIAPPKRPQEPKPPYPYYSEDVKFDNPSAKITLAGTLTLPKKDGVFPVVVLITGSGPQNRNEELLGHKPFLVLSDYLTRNGIGVLRYDDRGIGESGGIFSTSTTQDFAADVRSAVDYLKTRKDVKKNKIGLIGHSEGGIIAPMVAANSKDIAFIVLLAGTGVPGDQILLLQKELIERASGASESDIQSGQKLNKGAFVIIKTTANPSEIEGKLSTYYKQNQVPDKDASAMTKQLSAVWMQFFITYDPSPILKKVKCPVLAMNGENDLQVPAKVNLDAIKQNLEKAGNKKVTIRLFPKLNHLFQESEIGSPSEYEKIEQTFSAAALKEVTDWIIQQIK